MLGLHYMNKLLSLIIHILVVASLSASEDVVEHLDALSLLLMLTVDRRSRVKVKLIITVKVSRVLQ